MNKLIEEFQLVRNAFLKVKKDVSNSKGAIIDLDSKKADKEDIRVLLKEISSLRKELEVVKKTKPTTTKIIQREIKKSGYEVQIIGNKDSMKVHSSNCPYGKKITKDHLIAFKSVREAINKGYKRCSCVLNVK